MNSSQHTSQTGESGQAVQIDISAGPPINTPAPNAQPYQGLQSVKQEDKVHDGAVAVKLEVQGDGAVEAKIVYGGQSSAPEVILNESTQAASTQQTKLPKSAAVLEISDAPAELIDKTYPQIAAELTRYHSYLFSQIPEAELAVLENKLKQSNDLTDEAEELKEFPNFLTYQKSLRELQEYAVASILEMNNDNENRKARIDKWVALLEFFSYLRNSHAMEAICLALQEVAPHENLTKYTVNKYFGSKSKDLGLDEKTLNQQYLSPTYTPITRDQEKKSSAEEILSESRFPAVPSFTLLALSSQPKNLVAIKQALQTQPKDDQNPIVFKHERLNQLSTIDLDKSQNLEQKSSQPDQKTQKKIQRSIQPRQHEGVGLGTALFCLAGFAVGAALWLVPSFGVTQIIGSILIKKSAVAGIGIGIKTAVAGFLASTTIGAAVGGVIGRIGDAIANTYYNWREPKLKINLYDAFNNNPNKNSELKDLFLNIFKQASEIVADQCQREGNRLKLIHAKQWMEFKGNADAKKDLLERQSAELSSKVNKTGADAIAEEAKKILQKIINDNPFEIPEGQVEAFKEKILNWVPECDMVLQMNCGVIAQAVIGIIDAATQNLSSQVTIPNPNPNLASSASVVSALTAASSSNSNDQKRPEAPASLPKDFGDQKSLVANFTFMNATPTNATPAAPSAPAASNAASKAPSAPAVSNAASKAPSVPAASDDAPVVSRAPSSPRSR